MNEEKTSATVTVKPKQAEEAQGCMDWVEPGVWTPNMLTALQNGVKGGVWFSLIDKVYSAKNLEAAFRKVKSNRGAAGVDHISVSEVEQRLPEQLERIRQELQGSTYQPRAIKRVYIDKPGQKEKRPLGIPTVRYRVVQTALRQVIEPIYEREFAPSSYGSVISPLLANIYLNDLDHQLSDISLVRYADDLVVLCQTEDGAKSALETLKAWMSEAELRLHPDKTRIVDMRQSGNSFEFLGYRFVRRGDRLMRQPRRQSLKRFKDKVRRLTPRTSGQSLGRIIAGLNPVLRGWFGYYKHCRWRLFKELAALTIFAGLTTSSPPLGFTQCFRPIRRRVSPHRGNITNRRAGCGRAARPVRREGRRPNRLSYPYRQRQVRISNPVHDPHLRPISFAPQSRCISPQRDR